jgi:hypothetical protein
MSIPKHYYLMIDTETCGTLEEPLVYDIGMAIVDRHGTVYAKYSFVVHEVFIGMADLMKTAYYAEKIPKYWEDIESGKRKVVSFWLAKEIAKALIKKWGCVATIAHNMRFDNNALNNTTKVLSENKFKYFFPYGIEKWCTLKMAQQIYLKRPVYRAYCEKNGYLTSFNTPRLTAEILYRFITNDNNFIESHTGLEDVMIEKEILVHILRQHKKIQRTYYRVN